MDTLRKQRQKIISGGNDFDAMWPTQKKALEVLLKQTFPKHKAVVDTWIAAAASLDVLIALARSEYDAYLKNPAVTVDRPPLPADVDAHLRGTIK